ncbi:MAG: hypothetical protein ACO29V_14465 [Limnohabitans sp.]
MNTLCTVLPDLPPREGAERNFFVSTSRSDWCHDEDLADLHDAFIAEGIPYTVQHQPATIDLDGPDLSWADSCLSAADRNPSLCS